MQHNNTPADVCSMSYNDRVMNMELSLIDRGFDIVAFQNAPRYAGFWMVVVDNEGHKLTDAQIDEVADIIDPFGFDVDDTFESPKYMGMTTIQCPCNINP